MWVLTAAHCVGKDGPLYIDVTDRNGTKFPVDWIKRHYLSAPPAPCCGNANSPWGMDVAMAHLSRPFSPAVATSLANYEPIAGTQVEAYGYGYNTAFLSPDGGPSGSGLGRLRRATLRIFSTNFYDNNVPDRDPTHDRMEILPNQAGGPIQWEGDSGSPVFDLAGNLVGVQSTAGYSYTVGTGAVEVTNSQQVKSTRFRGWASEVMKGLAGDMNRDGHADILWHNKSTGLLQSWNLIDNSRISRVDIDAVRDNGGAQSSTPWVPMLTNDFNRDGMTDIVWHNDTTGGVEIWYMSLTSRIYRLTVDATRDGGGANVGAPWFLVGSGDFNRDGATDLLWHNENTGESQVWYMDGASRIGRATINASYDGGGANVAGDWKVVGVADFNGDQYPDILWHNDATGHTQIWYMSNYYRMSRAEVDANGDGGGAYVTAPWHIVGTNDFDRNNTADILWYNDDTHLSEVWYMSGPSRVRRATVDANADGGDAAVGNPWQIVRH